MSGLFLFLSLISLISCITAILKPALLAPIFKKTTKTQPVLLGGLTMLFLILATATTSPTVVQSTQVQIPTKQPSPTQTTPPTTIPTPSLMPTPTRLPMPTITPTPSPTAQIIQPTYAPPTTTPALSNTIPAGATAQCADNTYSFSQHRSGTCSHHGGVSQWL